MIFNIKHARNSFSSLTTADKIFVANDRNRAVCARLKRFQIGPHLTDFAMASSASATQLHGG